MRLYYRWLLAFLVIVAVLVILRSFFAETGESEEEVEEAPTFQWVDYKGFKKCRNSVQGSRILVDDRGYVCEWSDRLSTGCCFPEGATAKQFVCSSCKMNNCCSMYEHCVSCCLNPNKKTLLRTILANSSRGILKKVQDQFEFCLVKCRTSSESVIHENLYRNSKYKHCFGARSPETEPS